MLYLVIQTSLILLLTAALFFGLGVSYQRLGRRRQTEEVAVEREITVEHAVSSAAEEEASPEPVSIVSETSVDVAQLQAALQALEEQLAEKQKIIDELSQAVSQKGTEETSPEIVLMEKIPQMEAALETQGALLESKSLQLEKTKIQLDREREKGTLLEQKIAKMETDFEQLRQEQAQSLWGASAGTEEGEPLAPAAPDSLTVEVPIPVTFPKSEPTVPTLGQIEAAEAAAAAMQSLADLSEAKDREIETVTANWEQLREQFADLQAQYEEQQTRLRALEVENAGAAGLREKASRYQRELEEHQSIELALREELELQKSKQSTAGEDLQGRLRKLEEEAEKVAKLNETIAQYQRDAEGHLAAELALKEQLEEQRAFNQSRDEQTRERLNALEEEAKRAMGLRETISQYQRELEEHQALVASLREKIERQREAFEKREENISKTEEMDRSLVSRLENAEAELSVQRAELRRKEEELAQQYEAKERQMEITLENLRRENERAWAFKTENVGAEAESGMAALQEQESALRLRIEELRTDLMQKENRRMEWEEGRLGAIQRKLEEIEGELHGMERILASSNHGAGASWEAALMRVENLLKEQERHLIAAIGAPHAPAASSAAQELAARIAALEAELAAEKRAWAELTRTETTVVREPSSVAPPVQDAAWQRHLQEAQRTVNEKEQVISDLRRQLQDASVKLDPDLTGPDNLQLIHGVGPYTKKILKEEFGIATFKQLAHLSGDEITRISERLFFRGRIQREDWLGQAIALHFKKYGELVEVSDPPYPLKWAA